MDLNDQQFEDIATALNTFSGYTVKASGPNVAETPVNVFSVGTKAEGRHHPMPETASSLREYATQHAALLSRRNRNLGGWESGGKAWQDVPREYPHSPQGETAARTATLREDQEALGVLGTEEEGYLGDVNNPFHPANQKGDITAGNPAADAPVWAQMPRHTRVTSPDHLRHLQRLREQGLIPDY